ncbi:histone-lysine N-methyltransferase ASHR2-like [Melia azedarach]|uniref:Histone-lysine N-methyltransferase ASHR2-like n=1 Tax=Melia azedarach TaxID=155640 RepID=A0ACC1YAD6_MELAZ|nr:histone-lysine N-methyltransferase ASHR2-like [Melia azedarach]
MSAECMVTVAEIENRGRGLVATQPLKAGQIVLRDSPVLLYSSLLPSSSSYYCHNCHKTLQSSSSSQVCPSCSVVFCSPDCLTAAASCSHSPYLCQALSRLRNCPDLPLDRQVQARFLIAAYNLSLVNRSEFQVLLNLQGAVTDDDITAANSLHPLISSLFPPSSIPPLELTAALLAKDRQNAFGLMEPFVEDRQRSVRAYGIYPKASFFNHDCLPNACRFDYVDAAAENNNSDIIVRMIHDVPQGREICLSYFPVNLDYSTRQKRLLDDYGFNCDCDRCKVEANWSDNDNDNDNDVDDDENEEQLMEEEQDEEMAAADAENGGDTDFPHAYFFMRYMCDRNNCWGTLAPLPPSNATPSTVMECNVCGNLKNDAIGSQG